MDERDTPEEQKEPSKADIYGAAQRLCSAKIALDIARETEKKAKEDRDTADHQYSEAYIDASKIIPVFETVIVGKSMIVSKAHGNNIDLNLTPITVDSIKNEGDNNETE